MAIILDPQATEATQKSAAREQDVMIRAFDHVVRKNRHDSNQAAVVIGNASQALSLTHNYAEESVKEFRMNSKRYPLILSNWIKRTFYRTANNDKADMYL